MKLTIQCLFQTFEPNIVFTLYREHFRLNRKCILELLHGESVIIGALPVSLNQIYCDTFNRGSNKKNIF